MSKARLLRPDPSRGPRLALPLALAFACILGAAGCQHRPAPPVVAEPTLPLPPPPRPPPPPLPPQPPSPEPAVWSFVTGSTGCAALVAGDSVGLGIKIDSDWTVTFAVSAASGQHLALAHGAPVAIHFQGPAGLWVLSGRNLDGAHIEATMQAGDQALGIVLAVLGGGLAGAGDAVLGLPEMRIPPAGAAAAGWFACARARTAH